MSFPIISAISILYQYFIDDRGEAAEARSLRKLIRAETMRRDAMNIKHHSNYETPKK